MITAEMEAKPVVDDIDGVPEDDSEYKYVYPPELLKHWADISKDMKSKIARGELKPQTVEEVAAELGITLD
jgi:hypothetical protein